MYGDSWICTRQAENTSQSRPLTTNDISSIVTSVIKALPSNTSKPTPPAGDSASSSSGDFGKYFMFFIVYSARYSDYTKVMYFVQEVASFYCVVLLICPPTILRTSQFFHAAILHTTILCTFPFFMQRYYIQPYYIKPYYIHSHFSCSPRSAPQW